MLYMYDNVFLSNVRQRPKTKVSVVLIRARTQQATRARATQNLRPRAGDSMCSD